MTKITGEFVRETAKGLPWRAWGRGETEVNSMQKGNYRSLTAKGKGAVRDDNVHHGAENVFVY